MLLLMLVTKDSVLNQFVTKHADGSKKCAHILRTEKTVLKW